MRPFSLLTGEKIEKETNKNETINLPITGISISVCLIQSPLSKIAWFSRVSLPLTSPSQDNFLVQRDIYGTSWWWEEGVQGLVEALHSFTHMDGTGMVPRTP